MISNFFQNLMNFLFRLNIHHLKEDDDRHPKTEKAMKDVLVVLSLEHYMTDWSIIRLFFFFFLLIDCRKVTSS
jgi:hypothetical protein